MHRLRPHVHALRVTLAMGICAGFFAAFSLAAESATVWSGPPVGFLKTGTDDPFSVKDVLTANVSLTRGAAAFLFNPEVDAGAGSLTPSGTTWAFDTSLGNPNSADFSAANFASLSFLPFLDAVGGTTLAGSGPGVPNVVLNHAGVVHLTGEDIYFDIQFLQWTNPFSGAILEYVRSSAAPIPVPAGLPLLLGGLALLLPARLIPATPSPE